MIVSDTLAVIDQQQGFLMATDSVALYKHCHNVYEAMDALAVDMEGLGRVYEGYTTKLFANLGLAVPYYSAVLQELKRMGCIQQIKRGGGSSKSIWQLNEPPDEETFKQLPTITRYALGGRKVQLEFEQRVINLEERMSRAEGAMGL